MKKVNLTEQMRDSAALEIARRAVKGIASSRQAELVDRDLKLIAAGAAVFGDFCDDNVYIAEVLVERHLIPWKVSENVSSTEHTETWNEVAARLSWAAGELLKQRKGQNQ